MRCIPLAKKRISFFARALVLLLKKAGTIAFDRSMRMYFPRRRYRQSGYSSSSAGVIDGIKTVTIPANGEFGTLTKPDAQP